MEDLFTTANLIALLTLTLLEIVLGIDNIVFISIVCGRLPAEKQPKARYIGLLLAMVMRVLLLLAITWIASLTGKLFTVLGQGFSARDLIMLSGGLFLIAKSTREVHKNLENPTGNQVSGKKPAGSLVSALAQIVVFDMIFSLDSVITAMGMAESIYIMIAAIVVAIGIMMWASGPIGEFVNGHPTMKMLALAYMILIGVMLVADGFGRHIPKGYIYFAMAFSLTVELLNMWARKRRAKAAG